MKDKQINVRVDLDTYRQLKKAASGAYATTISKIVKRGIKLALKEMKQELVLKRRWG